MMDDGKKLRKGDVIKIDGERGKVMKGYVEMLKKEI